MQRIIKKINKGREWLFEKPTRSIELLTGLCAFFFSSVFLSSGSKLTSHKFYINFTYAGPYWIWILMFFVSIWQLKTLFVKNTLETEMLASILLKILSVIWFIIAIMFGSDYPPLNTAFFTYGLFSIITMLTGYEKSYINSQELLLRKELYDGKD